VLVVADKRTKFLVGTTRRFLDRDLRRNRQQILSLASERARADTMKKLLLAGMLLATPAYAEDTSCARQENRWDEHFQTWRMTCIDTFNSTKALPAPDDDNYPDPNIEKPEGWVYHMPTMDDVPSWLKLNCHRREHHWAWYRHRYTMCR
jgi:hypothetical protein